MSNNLELISLPKAADIMGISTYFVRQLAEAKQLKTLRIGERGVFTRRIWIVECFDATGRAA